MAFIRLLRRSIHLHRSTERIAALPMYDFPQVREAHDTTFGRVRQLEFEAQHWRYPVLL